MFAQSSVIRGSVSDINGDLLPGVNVYEKGTTNGITTDLEGEFRLQVTSDQAVLVF